MRCDRTTRSRKKPGAVPRLGRRQQVRGAQFPTAATDATGGCWTQAAQLSASWRWAAKAKNCCQRWCRPGLHGNTGCWSPWKARRSEQRRRTSRRSAVAVVVAVGVAAVALASERQTTVTSRTRLQGSWGRRLWRGRPAVCGCRR